MNRNISSHTSQIEGEHASLKASIPVSDIFEGLSSLSGKPRGGVAAGDERVTLGDYLREGIENIKSWFGGGGEESETQRQEAELAIKNELNALDQEILANSNDRALPEDIKAEVENKHPDSNEIEKQKLVNLSYNQLHTKLANGDYLSSAEDNSNYDTNNNDDRIGIFDKKKHGNADPKQKGKFKDSASVVASATGMPEPDEEGPENNEHNSFEKYRKKLKEGDKVDGSKIKYEKSAKHGHQSKGNISKAPTDPQEALNNAYLIKEESDQLIAFDFKNKEIVIFNRTNGNVYHGHAEKVLNNMRDHHKKLVEELAKNNQEIKNLIKLLK